MAQYLRLYSCLFQTTVQPRLKVNDLDLYFRTLGTRELEHQNKYDNDKNTKVNSKTNQINIQANQQTKTKKQNKSKKRILMLFERRSAIVSKPMKMHYSEAQINRNDLLINISLLLVIKI